MRDKLKQFLISIFIDNYTKLKPYLVITRVFQIVYLKDPVITVHFFCYLTLNYNFANV